MSIQAPANLPEMVQSVFERAKKGNHISMYKMVASSIIQLKSGPIQLRQFGRQNTLPVPSAAQTGVPPSLSTETDPARIVFDPLADVGPDLFVTAVQPAHQLILNKFPVFANHFMLVTTAFVPQVHLLTKEDLSAAYSCIEAYASYRGDDDEKRDGLDDPERKKPLEQSDLLGFYNSGWASGASQPHRHIQFVPIKSLDFGYSAEELAILHAGGDILADRIAQGNETSAARVAAATAAAATGRDSSSSNGTSAAAARRRNRRGSVFIQDLGDDTLSPFEQTYSTTLYPGIDEDELYRKYIRLYREAVLAVRDAEAAHGGEEGEEEVREEDYAASLQAIPTTGVARISYNLAITKSSLVILPRKSRGVPVHSLDGREEFLGTFETNGGILGGSVAITDDALYDHFHNNPALLEDVLKKV